MPSNPSPEQVVEVFRKTIPEMSRRAIPVDPVNYALWYAATSGENETLLHALRQAFPTPASYDAARAEALYREHIIQPRIAEQAEEQARVLKALTELLRQVAANSASTHSFGESLERSVEILQAGPDPLKMQETLRRLVADTTEARERNRVFERKLEDSQREIRELRERLARTEQEALTDALTGLPNRRAFMRDAEQVLAADGRGDSLVCLLIADVDHFKRINDTHGHGAGDEVLRRVGRTLAAHACDQIHVARHGGEEFVLLLAGYSTADARHLADRLREQVEGLRFDGLGGARPGERVSISIGVATRIPGEGCEELLARADRALYAAKHAGRNCVRVAAS